MKIAEKYSVHEEIYKSGYLFDPDSATFFTQEDPESFRRPPGYEDWSVEPFIIDQYGEERFKELGITHKNNIIEVIGNANDPNSKERIKEPIFTINARGGIEILQYGLDRHPYYEDKNKGEAVGKGVVKGLRYCWQERLHPWECAILEPGTKYNFQNAKVVPFWSPELVKQYEEEKEVETLVITEGQFKAWKATAEKIPTVGLTSISHFRDQETKTLHPEIISFIQKCKVQKVVVLWDGDCTNISSSHLKQTTELTKRPHDFFKYAKNIRDHLKKYIKTKDFRIYFATINSDKIPGNPKGIDDMFIEGINKDKIREEFDKIGSVPGVFLHWDDITTDEGVKDMRRFFALDVVQKFFEKHKELIGSRNFVFFGNTYRVEKGVPIMEVSKDLKNIIRVADEYYALVETPVNSTKGNYIVEERLTARKKSEISQDFGKDCFKHINTYRGFCNIANNIEYQQVIHGHWNLYRELKHTLIEGEFPTIRFFLNHVFEEHYENELIFDYFSILFRQPVQKLPVICLVSKDQGTGKSTFVNLLKWIFQQNMSIVSNADIVSEFNSHWTSSIVVACEETFFEKKEWYEKIKNLSTSAKIMRNEKNRTAAEIDNLLHFIFCSNHEDDFIKIDDYDSRLWIRKVKRIETFIDDFDAKLQAEVPFFLHYIANREIVYKKQDRLWFHPRDFMTDAKKNIITHSEPMVIKELRTCLSDYFNRHSDQQICQMTAENIRQFFNIRGEKTFINKMVKQYLKPDRWKNEKGEEGVTSYWFCIPKHEDPDNYYKQHDKGRPFVFKREDYV